MNKETENNIELVSSGLKCDNPDCDWKDETIKVQEWKDWINAKCPKCTQNVLTLEDYNNAMLVMSAADLVNEFTAKELEEVYKSVGLDDSVDFNKRVVMSIEMHNGIKIKSITPVKS